MYSSKFIITTGVFDHIGLTEHDLLSEGGTNEPYNQEISGDTGLYADYVRQVLRVERGPVDVEGETVFIDQWGKRGENASIPRSKLDVFLEFTRDRLSAQETHGQKVEVGSVSVHDLCDHFANGNTVYMRRKTDSE